MRNFYKGKRVLITGNTGFKGSWLSQTLRFLEADVCGVSLKPTTNPSLYEILNQESFIKENTIDVRNYEDLKKVFDYVHPEVVFHLAAQPIVIDSYKNPRYTYDVNVMGTVNVCECIRHCDSVSSFVNVTTDKVYLNNEWEYPYREIDEIDGYDPYSNSKSCSEMVTSTYIRSFFAERLLPVSTCRAGNVIGGGDFSSYRIVPDCYKGAVLGKRIAVRNPNSVRPYQHVLEAIMFYLYIAMRQTKEYRLAGAYNVGPEYEDCLKTSDLCELFCKAWGEEVSWYTILNEGSHESGYLRLDTSKAKAVLDWTPIWNVKEAVKETVLWYKSYVAGDDMSSFTNKQIERYFNNF